jgi:hypothetical protein
MDVAATLVMNVAATLVMDVAATAGMLRFQRIASGLAPLPGGPARTGHDWFRSQPALAGCRRGLGPRRPHPDNHVRMD